MEQFECIREIGRGGYGRIYLVRSLRDDSLRVIKEVDTSDMSTSERTRSTKEIEILRELHHYNIIRYISYVVRGSRLYILMEYARGGDLAQRISSQRLRKQRFSEETIVDWFVQMCLSLKYVHDRKIVHRDVKPSNFFIADGGIVKLGDFGLSACVDRTGGALHSRYGTPYYLAPEQCRGEPYNHKADVWALGCVLYELCALKRAYGGLTLRLIAESIQRDPPPKVPSVYSAELRALVAAMLRKDPNSRPAISDVLRVPFVRYKAVALLGKTQAECEFAHTVFHGARPCATPSEYAVRESERAGCGFEFIGRELALPRVRDGDSPALRAEALRALIEEMVGFQRFAEFYRIITARDEVNFRRVTANKTDKWVAKLVLQLVELEEEINRENLEKDEN